MVSINRKIDPDFANTFHIYPSSEMAYLDASWCKWRAWMTSWGSETKLNLHSCKGAQETSLQSFIDFEGVPPKWHISSSAHFNKSCTHFSWLWQMAPVSGEDKSEHQVKPGLLLINEIYYILKGKLDQNQVTSDSFFVSTLILKLRRNASLIENASCDWWAQFVKPELRKRLLT